MAKYTELSEGSRVIFNQGNHAWFDLRDASATVVKMLAGIPECVQIQLDEDPGDKTYCLDAFDRRTLTFLSHAAHLTLLPTQPQQLPEIDTLEGLV